MCKWIYVVLLASIPLMPVLASTDDYARLQTAVTDRNIPAIKNILDRNSKIINKVDDWYGTPLCIAVESDYYDVAKLLISRGAEVNFSDGNSTTPLIRAAENGNLAMVRLLIEHGAVPNRVDERDYTALWCAIDGDETEMAELLLDNGAKPDWSSGHGFSGESLLESAIAKGNLSITRKLIAKGAKLRPSSLDNAPLLCLAASTGKPEIAALLIDKGLDVNVTDRHEATPLLYAVRVKKLAMTKLLLSRGAKVNKRPKDSGAHPWSSGFEVKCDTPLMVAVEESQPGIVELLIEHGADVDEPIATPMIAHFGSARPQPSRVLYETPLAFAVSHKFKEVARILRAHGAKENHWIK